MRKQAREREREREREKEKKHDAREKTGRIMVQRKEYKVHTNRKKRAYKGTYMVKKR